MSSELKANGSKVGFIEKERASRTSTLNDKLAGKVNNLTFGTDAERKITLTRDINLSKGSTNNSIKALHLALHPEP